MTVFGDEYLVNQLKQICDMFFVSIRKDDFRDMLAVGTANTRTGKTFQLRGLASSREKERNQQLYCRQSPMKSCGYGAATSGVPEV